MYQRHSTEEKKITSFFGLGQFMAVTARENGRKICHLRKVTGLYMINKITSWVS